MTAPARTGLRSTADRIRHALTFELVGLGLLSLGGAALTGLPAMHLGVLGAVGAGVATLWNYAYNLAFDRLMLWRSGTTRKTVALRLLHAVLFELGLMAVLLPFTMWYLGLGFWPALGLDLGVALFYMAYALVFNWVYDRVFPLPPL
ncbi:PACE efflux transporter [Paracoccus jiaweipingae]|uniref:PACE efflux transporter n=1 Tax=unclassified Paracoccus (in: a-proteobacteria) TaxID=2688777 RepID=UPI00379500A6